MITGIVVALKAELSSITGEKLHKAECIFLNDNTLLVFSGAGLENASKSSQLLVDKGAERLISWGCATALKATLHSGDLILPQSLIAESQQHAAHNDIDLSSPWLHHVLASLEALDPFTGPLAESSVIVSESSEKKAIHKKTRAIALDMESVAIAKTAMLNNIPIIVIRTIADPVSMNLPKAVSKALNDQGDVVLSKLLWFLLTHPSQLPGLIKLGLHFNDAKNKLKLVAKHLDIIVGF